MEMCELGGRGNPFCIQQSIFYPFSIFFTADLRRDHPKVNPMGLREKISKKKGVHSTKPSHILL